MTRNLIMYPSKTEKGFYYVDMGYELHGRRSFRLWINKRLIEKDKDGEDIVRVTGSNREIVKTEKGSIVLRPSKDKNVFEVGRECGFRGSSWFEVKSNYDVIFYVEEWKSERGSLGVSQFGLIVTPLKEILVKEGADGRLYGAPEEWTKRYFIKGSDVFVEDAPDCVDDKELCEVLDGDL